MTILALVLGTAFPFGGGPSSFLGVFVRHAEGGERASSTTVDVERLAPRPERLPLDAGVAVVPLSPGPRNDAGAIAPKEVIGLYYFRNRYLDPEEGRFVSRDPIGVWGDPGNLGNSYAFCGGDPINRRDPFGLEWEVHIQGNFFTSYLGGIKDGLVDGVTSFAERTVDIAKNLANGDLSGAAGSLGEGVRNTAKSLWDAPGKFIEAMDRASDLAKEGRYDEANDIAGRAAAPTAGPLVGWAAGTVTGYVGVKYVSPVVGEGLAAARCALQRGTSGPGGGLAIAGGGMLLEVAEAAPAGRWVGGAGGMFTRPVITGVTLAQSVGGSSSGGAKRGPVPWPDGPHNETIARRIPDLLT